MRILGIVTGILLTILGLYALFVPFRTFMGIGWLLGLLLLITGIEMVIMASKKEGANAKRAFTA